MKRIKDIVNNSKLVQTIGSLDLQISAICMDSREVKADTLFVAVKGTQVDGHRFISQCIEQGAVAIVCETIPENQVSGVTYLQVEDSAEALAEIASLFYGNPSAKLTMVGVTGTNGKTTIATLLFDLFTALGFPCGLLSTVENRLLNRVIPSTHTTPNAIALNQFLAEMVDAGCQYCFMEVSSHAIDQKRVAALTFAGGVFTNITHDHLDYHKTFKAYISAKKAFFDALPKQSFALTNLDDKNGLVMLQNCAATKLTYSLQRMADFRCKIIENHFEGLLLNMDGKEAWFRLVGKFNASNLTAIYGVARALGLDSVEVLSALSALPSVEGRFDAVTIHGRNLIVDYAHTPDALESVLSTINAIREGNGSLITVVGCGGDRDRTKRPEMARIAAELSTQVILTSDNPRTEDPEQILDEMEQGLDPVGRKKTLRISSRKEAIRTAVRLSDTQTVILVAGKGHEKYQEINAVRTPFDDKEISINALNQID